MKVDVAKVNERWKKGLLLAFAGAFWVFHFVTAAWFAAHSEPVEAEVLARKEWMLPGRRHGWTKLEVAYVDAQGKPATRNIEWHVTRAPAGKKIQIWRAETGVIKAGPASLAETFFVETMLAGIVLLIGAFVALALAFLWLQRKWRGLRTRQT